MAALNGQINLGLLWVYLKNIQNIFQTLLPIDCYYILLHMGALWSYGENTETIKSWSKWVFKILHLHLKHNPKWRYTTDYYCFYIGNQIH